MPLLSLARSELNSLTTSNLLRASGAAIVAGVLRATDSFVPDGVPYSERQILYGLTNTFHHIWEDRRAFVARRESGVLGFLSVCPGYRLPWIGK